MREISIIKQNILKYLDFKGVSKYEFYQKTGISNGILSQSNGISEDNILKFLSYYSEINPEWLLTGKGEMLKNEKAIRISQNITGNSNIMSGNNTNISESNDKVRQLKMELQECKSLLASKDKEIEKQKEQIDKLFNMIRL